MVRASVLRSLVVVVLLGSCSAFGQSLLDSGARRPGGSIPAGAVDVFFSPRGGAADAVVAELGKAWRSVLVQAYSFTSAPIAEALVKAHKRGVKVQVLLDDSNR